MEPEMKWEDETLTVYLRGELDHHNTCRLREAIDGAMRRLLPRCVVLDLSQTAFCDSAALGLILGRVREARRLGASLTLENVPPAVRRILDLAGGAEFFQNGTGGKRT